MTEIQVNDQVIVYWTSDPNAPTIVTIKQLNPLTNEVLVEDGVGNRTWTSASILFAEPVPSE